MPNGDDLSGLYPEAAVDNHVEGWARMKCRVMADGRLQDCSILAEEPPGFALGKATLYAARFFKMRPQTIDGAPVESASVLIPLVWQLPPDNGYGVNPPTLDPPQTSKDGKRRTTVSWSATPAYADLDALFPKAAADNRVGGQAVMRCSVQGDGGLSGCAIVTEAPQGYGLGEATLALASKYRVSPTTSEGGPTAGLTITTTVTWSLAQRRMAHLYAPTPR